jgi:hypothetical protein
MPQESGLVTVVATLLAIPFILVRDLWRLLMWLNRWRLQRAGLPPALLNRSRAVAATFAMALIIDLAWHLPLLTGDGGVNELVATFLRTHVLSPVLALLIATLALALLFLIVGLTRGGRAAPRDPIAALMALGLAAGAAGFLWQQYYVTAELIDPAVARYANTLLHALYIATLSAALMRTWLSMPLIGANALRRILQHIQERTGRLRPARRRSY